MTKAKTVVAVYIDSLNKIEIKIVEIEKICFFVLCKIKRFFLSFLCTIYK